MKIIAEQKDEETIEITVYSNNQHWHVSSTWQLASGTSFTFSPGTINPEQQRIQELEARIANLESELEAALRTIDDFDDEPNSIEQLDFSTRLWTIQNPKFY
jgi:hypothetical protein